MPDQRGHAHFWHFGHFGHFAGALTHIDCRHQESPRLRQQTVTFRLKPGNIIIFHVTSLWHVGVTIPLPLAAASLRLYPVLYISG